jgi:transposase
MELAARSATDRPSRLICGLQPTLTEYGHVVPQGIHHMGRILEILDEQHSDLPALMREECRDLLDQIAEKTKRIDVRNMKIKELAAAAETARRLQTIPGVGPLTALAVEAFAPPMESFRCGRDFAAWLVAMRVVGRGGPFLESNCRFP